MLRIINILTFAVLALLTLLYNAAFAQEKPSFILTDDDSKNNIYMTWNKNTPETEMKDDIQALAEKGITITYSNLKRNSNNEITAIKVTYADRKGNTGAMELNNQNPINTIKFYKQGEEVGFGQPSHGAYAVHDLLGSYAGDGQIFNENFNFGNGAQSFNFSFPDNIPFGDSQESKIIIKKDGKKPLVIQNGEVIEGGDDYTKEELEEIKKNNTSQFFQGMGEINGAFDFRNEKGLENFKKQMEKLQIDLGTMDDENGAELSKEDMEKTKEELLKAKEEMIKAKEEMEKARRDLQKAKPKKTQKS